MCIVFKVEEIRCEGGRDMMKVVMILVRCVSWSHLQIVLIIPTNAQLTSTIQLIENAVDIIELELYLVLVLLGDIVPFGWLALRALSPAR